MIHRWMEVLGQQEKQCMRDLAELLREKSRLAEMRAALQENNASLPDWLEDGLMVGLWLAHGQWATGQLDALGKEEFHCESRIDTCRTVLRSLDRQSKLVKRLLARRQHEYDRQQRRHMARRIGERLALLAVLGDTRGKTGGQPTGTSHD